MDDQTGTIRLLLARLERVSADSFWAHRASGIRGALLRALDDLEKGRPVHREEVRRLLASGFNTLNRAAKEMVR